MAIYKPKAIENKCTSLWHFGSPKIELTNPKKDGLWHIDPNDYHLLVDQSNCLQCDDYAASDTEDRKAQDTKTRELLNARKA